MGKAKSCPTASRMAVVGKTRYVCVVFSPSNSKYRKHHEPFLETVEESKWCSAGGVEHKLEFTEVYNLFLRHFEDKISGMVHSRGGGRRSRKV